MARPPARHRTVLERFEHMVETVPNAPFVYHGDSDRHFSYKEFDDHTDRFAAAFQALEIGHQSRVAVLATDSLLYAATMIASWKCAGIYCPLNAQVTPNLIADLLNDLKPKCLVVDESLLSLLAAALAHIPAEIAPIVILDTADCNQWQVKLQPASCFTLADLETEKHDGQIHPPSAQDLASIVYTSGTTRRPKGVMHSHAWAANVGQILGEMTHSEDVLHCDIPLYHIGGAYMMLVRTLWSGASMALWNKFSASHYWSRVEQSGASITILLDVMVDWMLAQPARPEDRRNTLIRAHMQPLRPDYAEFAQRFGIDFIAVGYGSTEVGIAFTGLIDVFGDRDGTPKALWKGLSREDIRAKVRSLAGKAAVIGPDDPAPAGYMGCPIEGYSAQSNGALRIKAPTPSALFDGYLNQPELTSQAIENGWYTSPDMAQHEDDGRFTFLGRSEGFIRTRGENISALSLEDTIKTHPSVASCAAIGIEAQQGGEDDIAIFAVASDGASLEEAALRIWMQKQLPDFMQPRYVKILGRLPLTATMKVAKHELKALLEPEE